jgi:hypothetical protein
MEPILELATQITSHLWLFHGLYPDEADVAEVLNSNWREILEEQAARDYSRVQELLDLTDLTKPGDWNPTDPLCLASQAEENAPADLRSAYQSWRTVLKT